MNVNEYSDIKSGDMNDYTGYFAILQRLDIDPDFVCGSDKVGSMMYQYPYSGASSYSTYYTNYQLILDSYMQNAAVIPTDVKVYKRIGIKTLY